MMSSIKGNAATDGAQVPAVDRRPNLPSLQVDKVRPAAVQEVAEPTSKEMESAVSKLNEFVGLATQNVQFSIDQDSGKTIVKVVDAQTQEVLRQIPNAEALSMSRSLDKLRGILIRDKA